MNKINFKLLPARKSNFSKIPVCLAYVNCTLIGTHEKIDIKKFTSLFISLVKFGYLGPPICVIIPDFNQCEYFLEQEENIPTIIPSSYGDIGIADGHNRLAVIKLLNHFRLIKGENIIVQILPTMTSDNIKICTLSIEEEPLTLNQICGCFNIQKKVISPKSTSHFRVRLTDDSYVRVRDSQPDLIIKKSDFFRGRYENRASESI